MGLPGMRSDSQVTPESFDLMATSPVSCTSPSAARIVIGAFSVPAIANEKRSDKLHTPPDRRSSSPDCNALIRASMSSLGPAKKTSAEATDGMAEPIQTSSAATEAVRKSPKNMILR